VATGVASRYVASAEKVEFDFLTSLDVDSRSVGRTMRDLSRGVRALGTDEPGNAAVKGLLAVLPSGILSTVVHVVALLTGALWFLPPNVNHSVPPLVVTEPEEIDESEEVFEEDVVLEEDVTEEEKLDDAELKNEAPSADQVMDSQFDDLAAKESSLEVQEVQLSLPLPIIDRLAQIDITHNGGAAFSGRGRTQRAIIVSEVPPAKPEASIVNRSKR
jgi:hypothetical protein